MQVGEWAGIHCKTGEGKACVSEGRVQSNWTLFIRMLLGWILERGKYSPVFHRTALKNLCKYSGHSHLTYSAWPTGWRPMKWRRLRWRAPACTGYRCLNFSKRV